MHLRKNESGSIMLEVVAVLALMGVMGAMLFRQVFQRNQELHNIQMASEIRTVKEAYSAYIQAYKAQLMQQCLKEGVSEVNQCNISSNTLSKEITGYLPEGWFGEEGASNELNEAYNFYIYAYLDASNRQVLYGLVVPTASTLPESNWYFKRAARVALLVGADGGAYDSTITAGEISGSLGSWHMPTADVVIPTNSEGESMPFYAATTGIDIFVPEYEPPEGKVNLPQKWDLALRNLHAYGTFSAGNSETGHCYNGEIQHNTSSGTPATVNSDSVFTGTPSGNCKPLFWVEDGTTGTVNVATDLNIGEIVENDGNFQHNEALKLTKEGRVVQKEGLTIGTDGRIIAKETVPTDVGDLKRNENYVLDPAYTSTMNDIRLASRGGVRLSEILPNYILKEQKEIYCTIATTDRSCSGDTTSIDKPTCPSGYKKALVVIPTAFGQNMNFQQANVDASDNSALQIRTGSASSLGIEHTHDIGIEKGEIASAISVTVDRRQFQVYVENLGDLPANANANDTGSWQVTFAYSSNVDNSETVRAIAQTYCVFESSIYAHQPECEAAGWTWDESCQSTRRHVDMERTEQACKEGGYVWDSGRCQGNYATTETINNYGSGIDKAKACKAAGHTWNENLCS